MAGFDSNSGPFALIQLDDMDEGAWFPAPPPVPLIGVGDPAHPLAHRMDCVIEPPVSVEWLVRAIAAMPLAAAALVQLLRGIDAMSPETALLSESFGLAMLQGSVEHRRWQAARQLSAPLAAPGIVHVARADDVLHVTVDRPAARNAIDRAVRDGLRDAFAIAVADRDIRAIRLRGTGRSFGMGADLAEFGTTTDPATAHAIRAWTLPAAMLQRRPGLLEAHVQGGCVGASLEIAAFADRLTASPDAWFQLPEIAMGLLPGAGGCLSVSRRIGRQRAALLMLSGRRIDAATALRWGLIDAIVDAPPGDEGGAHMG